MRFMQWVSALLAATVITACFFTWVTIDSKGIYYGGFESNEPSFGKPGLFHVFLCGISLLFILLGKIWSLRTAFFISMFNIAWALRNFFLIGGCRAAICPDKQPALYLVLIGSVLLPLSLLFITDKKTS